MTRAGSPGLAGRTAVITGGAGGIGQATASLLIRAGARVAVLDQAIPDAPAPLGDVVIQTDVNDARSVSAAARVVADEFGNCDTLVVAAGVAVVGAAGMVSEADWDRVFSVNVRGAWLTFREFLPVLSRPASVITVASAAGLRPMPQLAAYSAAKAALIGLTRSIALDYAADGIRANCVCPGQVDTPLAARVQDERPPRERSAVTAFTDYPIKRVGRPGEVAAAIAFLADPGNGYTTGSVLTVDGGRTLH